MYKRKTRAPSKKYPPFDYEEHNIDENELELFIRIKLDNIYASPEEKEDFFNRFVYYYLTDKEFKKSVKDKDKVLVFEGPKYVGYTDRDNFNRIGDPEKPKNIINIGKLSNVGNLFGIKQTSRYEIKKNG